MPDVSPPPVARRRWYRFSLRTLLVVVLALTVAFSGWVSYRRHRAKVNRYRLAAIEESLARIEQIEGYNEHGSGHESAHKVLRPRTWLEDLFDDPGSEGDPSETIVVSRVILPLATTDADLVHLKALTHLQELSLTFTQVTDAGLEHLASLTDLKVIWMEGIRVDGTGFKHLRGLKNLESLTLGDTQFTDAGFEHPLRPGGPVPMGAPRFTDAGLKHLKELTKLRSLGLEGTRITDAGLAHLRKLTSLEYLILRKTQITDAGLEHLKGLSKLKSLDIAYTQYTDDGLNRLRRALPTCSIMR